jgi:hypothetical protein
MNFDYGEVAIAFVLSQATGTSAKGQTKLFRSNTGNPVCDNRAMHSSTSLENGIIGKFDLNPGLPTLLSGSPSSSSLATASQQGED